MTATSLSARLPVADVRRRRLWGASFLAVALAHGALLTGALAWHNGTSEPPPVPPAAMIDMAPLPAPPAPAAAPAPLPEPPRPVTAQKPEPAKRVQSKPKAAPQPPQSQAILPETRPTPPQDVPQQVADVAAPSPARESRAAATPSPATAASPPAAASDAAPTWQGLLRSHLERFKRYPSSAQARRQQGVATVRFVMDRQGNVLSAAVERSSGVSRLDEESLELLDRAQPLPAPPPEVAGDKIELVVPIQFFLK